MIFNDLYNLIGDVSSLVRDYCISVFEILTILNSGVI